MDELKPCPFCGGRARVYEAEEVGWVAQCKDCGTVKAYFSPARGSFAENKLNGFICEKDAIAAWNKRYERKCIFEPDEDVETPGKECSRCGRWVPLYEHFNYCPDCGSKVIEE